MAQYISKSAVVAEIEKRTDELCNYSATEPEEFLVKGASLKPLMELRLFLDTLEVKEVDINKEISQFIDANFEKATIGHKLSLRRTAKYFFELGLKVSNKAEKKEVEEEPYIMGDTGSYITTTK